MKVGLPLIQGDFPAKVRQELITVGVEALWL